MEDDVDVFDEGFGFVSSQPQIRCGQITYQEVDALGLLFRKGENKVRRRGAVIFADDEKHPVLLMGFQYPEGEMADQ